MVLYQGLKKKVYTLTTLPTDPLLRVIGIRAGQKVEVITRQPFGGPIVVRIGQRDIALDKTLASAIGAEVVF